MGMKLTQVIERVRPGSRQARRRGQGTEVRSSQAESQLDAQVSIWGLAGHGSTGLLLGKGHMKWRLHRQVTEYVPLYSSIIHRLRDKDVSP